jgi:uncharacterized protein DUF6941
LRVDWVVTCRYAESDGQIATIVGAGIDVLQVPVLPSPVAIMVAVRLVGQLEELDREQQHLLSVGVLRPDGSPVRTPDGALAPPMTAQFSAPPNLAQRVPGWLVAPTFALVIQWWADEAGSYSIAVSVGDDDPTQTPVHVLPPPPA